MKYYYLYLSPNLGGLDSKKIEFLDIEARPPIIGKVGLALGDHPLDELFRVAGLYFVTDNLTNIIIYYALQVKTRISSSVRKKYCL